jgi:ribose transport system ATP-binding protein
MRGISKTFNQTVEALKTVDFVVGDSEIHGLVGENGAGKSTLMNILGGVVERDEGELYRFGEPVEIRTPQEARDNNISFIHQELNLVPDLRVYENIFLGEELTTGWGTLDVRRMCEASTEVLQRMDIDLDPMAVVRDLGATRKQVVEIARAIRQQANLIIMDEPTTSLTDHEIEHLFEIMRSLRQGGVSIVFISHKIKEILTVCNAYTVLRDGEVADNGTVDGVGEEEIVRKMVGRELAQHEYYEPRQVGQSILEVRDLSAEGAFRNIDFSLHRGEILGFTGLVGDGRSELFESIFGYRPYDSGEIRVDGRAVRVTHPTDAAHAGMGYAPKDRKENAIVNDLTVLHNISLPSLRRFIRGPVIDQKRELQEGMQYAERLRIKMRNINDPIRNLSGGNQQKAVLAKWLEAGSDIIILDNPTQGIDVGAKGEIYELMVELAKAGKAVVMLSSEFGEILRVCDRIIVMFHGEKTGELPRSQANEEVLTMYATGVRRDTQEDQLEATKQ